MDSTAGREPRRIPWRLSSVIVLAILGLTFLAIWGPAMYEARESSRVSRCEGNYKSTALTACSYEQVKRVFPPAYSVNAEGHPTFSWRTLILPIMGGEVLYEKIHQDEPWNSPHNRAVAEGVPYGMTGVGSSLYHCPSDRSPKLEATQVMVVGKNTFSDGPHGRQVTDFTQGTSNTIMIAEMAKSGIQWMEPRDLKFDAMSFKINDPKRDCIRTVHKDGWCAGFADGSVHCMNKNIDPDILKCLLTIDGRGDGAKRLERIDWSELEVP